MGRHLGKPIGFQLKRMFSAYGVDSIADLASAMGGVTESMVRNWHKRDAVPDGWLRRASEETGVDIRFFLDSNFFDQSGKLVKKSVIPTHLNDQNSDADVNKLTKYAAPTHLVNKVTEPVAPAVLINTVTESPVNEFDVAGMVAIPRYNISLSAGHGTVPDGEQVCEVDAAFSQRWMRQHLGRVGDGFVMADVDGNSMEPTLMDGESVIMDTHKRDISTGGVFALRLDGDVLVKRLQRKLSGALLVLSDNDSFDTEEVGPDQARDIEVIGRVVWPRVR